MKTRISEKFRILKKNNKKAFIPYIMAGDPSLENSKEIFLMLEECGADIIELGVPFSDPLADGPVIQRAAERALKNNVTLKKVISFVKEIRDFSQTPVILMTYFNPIYKYGISEFMSAAERAGVDGIIVPDLPPEEAHDIIKISRKTKIDTIFLLAPTSTQKRIKKVISASTGFIYYVSITGITGSNILFDGSMEKQINDIRKYTDKPIAVGFGVSKPEDASEVAKIADGVIVGSAIVKKLYENPTESKDFIKKLREAI